MEEPDQIAKLLEEIRDLQKESLEEYKRVTFRSLDLQQKAVSRQEQLGRNYRLVLIASATLIIFIAGLIIYLLQFFPSRVR